ncbi:TIGR03943 family protein [Streptomyces sp. NA04227]|uniref:TIGR03943 family putative permease subunit n=1 Tax=Streptomyces sp. NA04227 TaxID=2742136 RepID=UPI00158FCFCB|nr:TIGR03943 family protein [Streptomyces sp. NA04227]QKW09573.1 TIGR03943 family protein [Streptomyces sp. NA04227]
MKKSAQPLLLVLIGVGLLRITVGSDLYLRYVKEGLRIPLVVSGLLLVLIGLAGAVAVLADRLREPVTEVSLDANGQVVRRTSRDAHAEHDGHDHDGHGHGEGGTRVVWLLAVPALTLLFLAPPALGSYTASRDRAAPTVEKESYDALGEGPVAPMRMGEFIGRSVNEPKSLAGRRVTLMGFVVPGEKPGTWYLSRITVKCCAADARTMRIEVHGVKAPPADTWAQVTGTWRDATVDPADPLPALDADGIRRVSEPRSPYRDLAPAAPAKSPSSKKS